MILRHNPTPNPNPNMSPFHNQLMPLTLSRGQAIIAQKSTQSRQGATAQSQTRPELPRLFVLNRAKKRNTPNPRHYKTYDSSINSSRTSNSSTSPASCPFKARAKNQGESSWLKVNQGESRPFETFFYAFASKMAHQARVLPVSFWHNLCSSASICGAAQA
jgi:hypothetical protein